ncbi:glycosyltransferase [Amycolatopsis benzoatilytica]|uniref:glycosyltransferase n=1 Tax=Amycolatopsis benzoatilytica TaxID=346045 RepID=UPI00047F6262|nr:glycosyltransferase [Amycolatopsis benzoatilytica]
MERPTINPALGLELTPERTLKKEVVSVSVVIPAHNEAETIGEVVEEVREGLDSLGLPLDVLVSASGCTDATAEIAASAGARVVEAPTGKGAAVSAGLAATDGEIVCLIDGDIRYYGDPPLVPLLVEPILNGIADAVVSDLYWRPLYPQLWLYGFFAPLAGSLFPELLPKVGSTPWSGQRAAKRHLWPKSLPKGFTMDLALLLHWNEHALRMRPVLADDWVNPQRPKPDLMRQEHDLLVDEAIRRGRIPADAAERLAGWFETAHELMAQYDPGQDDPQAFEARVLESSLAALRPHLAT